MSILIWLKKKEDHTFELLYFQIQMQSNVTILHRSKWVLVQQAHSDPRVLKASSVTDDMVMEEKENNEEFIGQGLQTWSVPDTGGCNFDCKYITYHSKVSRFLVAHHMLHVAWSQSQMRPPHVAAMQFEGGSREKTKWWSDSWCPKKFSKKNLPALIPKWKKLQNPEWPCSKALKEIF